MSDALLERMAVALEKLAFVHANVPAQATPEPAKPAKAPKAPKEPKAEAAPAAAAPTPAVTPSAAVAATDADDLMTQAANAVINLANNFSRDSAIEAMAKIRIAAATPQNVNATVGAKKVSQITDPAQLKALLADVNERIKAEEAKKANESLV